MRILTTWIYFDSSQVTAEPPWRGRRRGRGEEPEPWYRHRIVRRRYDNVNADLKSESLSIASRQEREEFNEEIFRGYLDAFLMDAEEYEFSRPEHSLKNPAIVDHVLAEPVVIERSPPVYVTLKGLITATNLPVWIGTYMGVECRAGALSATLRHCAGRIIIVSSAAVLANALSAGLSTSMKRLFRKKQ